MATSDDNLDITNEAQGKGKVVDLWSDKNVTIFVELMEREVMKNNRTTTTFTKESWQTIKHELNQRTGLSYSLEQLRNKFNKLRGVYRDFRAIFKETGMGFTYDPTTGRIFASDDQWKRLAGVNKHARQFQRNGCPLFGKLTVIYGDTTATGDNAHAYVKAPSSSDESDHVYESNDADLGDDDVVEVKAQSSKKNEKGKRKRDRRSRNFSSSEALQEIASTYAESQKRKNDILQQKLLGYSSSNNSECGNDAVRELYELVNTKQVQCIKKLEELKIENKEKCMLAIKILTTEASWRDTFLAMSEDWRVMWVESLTP